MDTRDTVPVTQFDLTTVKPQERFDLWRDSMNCLYDVQIERAQRRNFSASITSVLMGPMMLARSVVDSYQGKRSARNIALDGHDHYMVRLFEQGQAQMQLSDGGELQIEPGDIVITDLSRESSCKHSALSNLALIIPRPELAPLLKQPDNHHQRHLSATDSFTILLRQHIQTLMQQRAALPAEQIPHFSSATLGMVASALNGLNVVESPEQALTQQNLLLSSIRRYIDQHLYNPDLSPSDIACAVGVSRSKLYVLAETLGGIAGYIRERRLQLATRRLMAEPDRPIADIALETGFSSSSDFSRVFRKHFDMSPREMRNQPTILTPEGITHGPVDRRYEHWIHQL